MTLNQTDLPRRRSLLRRVLSRAKRLIVRPAAVVKPRGLTLQPCDVRLSEHAPGRTTHQQGMDRSGTILYAFNSLGYRSEEVNPAAKFRLCVIGESHAFGLGVTFEATFGYRLKQHIATALGLGLHEVNLINLSVGGASADYCVRTIFRQLADFAVDLLVFQLPREDRTEYVEGNDFLSLNVSAVDLGMIKDAPPPLLAFCDYYAPSVGQINLMKNALMAQAFLKERRINVVLATHNPQFSQNTLPYLQPFFAQLDPGAVLQHSFFAARADKAADNTHAGPRSHAAFAIAALGSYGNQLRGWGNIRLGAKIAAHAAHLQATDPDLAYCLDFITELHAYKDGESA